MDADLPDYPYDLEELKHIEKLLSKIPLYQEKISELLIEIDQVSKMAQKAGAFSNPQEIDYLIYKAFYLELENRPFNSEFSNSISRLKAEIRWEGKILNRNIPCEICGENRSVDKCHIIPAKDKGMKNDPNILYLCPTHHRLFDRFMLTKAEWAQIDWSRKSLPSQEFIQKVTFEAHRVFWSKLELSQHEKIRSYEINEKPFVRHVVDKLEELFISGRLIKKSNIYNLLEENIRGAAKIAIEVLIKHKLLIKIENASGNMLTLGKKRFSVTDNIIEEIWKQIN